MMRVRFLRSVPGYGYFRGDTGDVADDAAAALVNAGAAVVVPEVEGGDALCLLPEDMPMRELLAENGYVSMEQVAAAGEALTEIAGIGKKSAERIVGWCKERLTTGFAIND